MASEPCKTDADCTKAPRGFCSIVSTSHYPGCGCTYGCVRDTDCARGEICECGDPVGICVRATCTTDSACPTGSLCASAALGWGGCSFYPPAMGFECQASGDTCLTNQDCAVPGAPACAYNADAGVRGCHPGQMECP